MPNEQSLQSEPERRSKINPCQVVSGLGKVLESEGKMANYHMIAVEYCIIITIRHR